MKRKVKTSIKEGRNGSIYRKIDASESTFHKIARITKWISKVELETVSVNTHNGTLSADGHKKQMISVTGTTDDPICKEDEVVLRLDSLGHNPQHFQGSVDSIDYYPTTDGSKSFTAFIYVNKSVTPKVSELT